MNHQTLTQRLFRFFPALFTLAALGLAGWAVVDRPAPSTTAAAVSLTTIPTADSPLPAVGTDVRRRIEDVRVGDLVWAYDEQTGQLEKRPVTALFRSQTDHLRVLTLESESGQRQRIETTDEHPFWVAGYGWQDAQLLRPGDRLLEPDQSRVTVIASDREEHPDGLVVYNFEVAGLHDYFVSATTTDSLVLSHNKCSRGGGASNKTVAQLNREKSISSGIPESQLGPSGLPKIHTPAHASIKEAKEAARRRVGAGGTTVKHPSPTVGEPHFHGVKPDGTKIRIHDEFPKVK